MYTKLEKLTEENINSLKTLMSSVSFTDKKKRLGAHGLDKLSIYLYSKWHDWDRNKKQTFKSNLPLAHVEKSLIGWFLHFPETVGFLDVMDAWVGKTMAGNIVAYALEENQKIWIDNQEILLEKGEGIKFSLRYLHEIKAGNPMQNWACLMLLD
jgi:hypothetical protein